MDGILTLEQYIILIRITSFLRTFKNAELKLTPLPALPTLLGTATLTLLHLYRGAITYLDSVTCSIFQTSLLTLYLALPTKEIG